MSDDEANGWAVLLPWDDVLAYGPFLDRFASALALRRGLDPATTRASLEALRAPILEAPSESGTLAAALTDALECELDSETLDASLDASVAHRIPEVALLAGLDAPHRAVIVGDGPSAVARRLGEAHPGAEVRLSCDLRTSLAGDEAFDALLAALGHPAERCVLVSEDAGLRARAEAKGLAAFEIRDRDRRLPPTFHAWLRSRSGPAEPESEAAPDAEGEPGEEGSAGAEA